MKKYVKEYKGHQVPEGADSFGEKNDFFPQNCFYKDSGSKVFVVNQWMKTLSQRKDLIPLPEARQELDWSAAPSDVAVWITANDSRIRAGWFEYDKKREVFMACDGSGTWWPASSENMEVHYQPTTSQSEPVKWNGEGLPPVSTVCEFIHSGISSWQYGEVIYHLDNKIVLKSNEEMWSDTHGIAIIHIDNSLKFRPLKTQQEKKREAFINAVAGEFLDGEFDRRTIESIASRLFRAEFAAPKAAD
tara:strand:+ start:45547 stop:46284 length:738 start_codon:yes stop_codon:yes gene_type:complete